MAIYNGDNNDNTYNGTATNDEIHGGDGNDQLNGLGGDDIIYGDNGDDVLAGGTGNDSLYGGVGSDTYLTAKNDGQDTIFSNDTTMPYYHLLYQDIDVVKFTDAASTDITQVSRVSRNYPLGEDLLLKYGDNSQLLIQDYFLYIDIDTTHFQFDTPTPSSNIIDQFQFSDGVTWSWQDIKQKVLQGGNGDDTLLGFDDSNDTLDGGPGNDTMKGGFGDDTYKIDSVNDTAQELPDHGNDTIISSVTYRLPDNIENLGLTGNANEAIGNSQNNVLTGNETDNTLIGLDGNDSLYGGNGNDVLRGDNGDDILDGGNGTDTASYWLASAAVTVNLNLTGAQNTNGAGNDSLHDIENLSGGRYGDTLIGNALANQIDGGIGNDTLIGNGGNDKLSGGAGNDTLDGGGDRNTALYWDGRVGVTVNLGISTAQNTVGSGTDTLSNIENLYGCGFTDQLTGNTLDNLIYGGAGNDTISCGDGDDRLAGGMGDDTLDGGNGNDTALYWKTSTGVSVNLNLTGAQDTGGAGNDTLSNIENLLGSNFNDNLTGNALDNELYGLIGDDNLSGGDGNDRLSGGDGNDTLDGGNGVDTAWYGRSISGVTVDLSLATAQDTVGAGIDHLISIENLSGSDFNDTLTGNAANNRLSGKAGNDILSGGLGKDILTGGTGQDTFVFSTLAKHNNTDIITDFNTTDDSIQLDHGVFTILATTGPLAETAFKIIGNDIQPDSDDAILYNTNTGGLFYDADGSGSTSPILIALVGSGLALTSSNFTVI